MGKNSVDDVWQYVFGVMLLMLLRGRIWQRFESSVHIANGRFDPLRLASLTVQNLPHRALVAVGFVATR
jgi:hypothetical protein